MSAAGWLPAHLGAELEQAATEQAERVDRLRAALELAEERVRSNPKTMTIDFGPADSAASK